MISKWKTRRAFRFELVTHDSGFITEKPRRATGVEPAIPGIQVCVSASRSCAAVSPPRHRGLGWGSTGEQYHLMVGYTLSVRRFKKWTGWDAPISWPAAQPGVTWPLTPLRSQGVPRRSMPRILDSQPNSIAFVRVASVRPPLPTTRMCVYYDGICGPCVGCA